MRRRQFLYNSSVLAASTCFQGSLPVWAQSHGLADMAGVKGLQGSLFDLEVNQVQAKVAGKSAEQIQINGQFPAPLLRWREGDDLTINVHNQLREPTSIHWHGILLPWQMDGVPGVSFAGIAPSDRFSYRFKVKQAGTYWYHSHSGLQEQSGHYGPLIIDPIEPEPFRYQREYVVLLSDWTFEKPQRVYSKLKKMSSNYNYQQRTFADFVADVRDDGWSSTLNERKAWGAMRMSRTDLADVTAATYTYLVNGHSPLDNWTGLFTPGETVRLRFINAAAMSIFNVRIPGLAMTVVLNDGQYVQPVATDEFQIGNGETFDVLVTPTADQAFTIFAESNDRFGFARATLAPQHGMQAEVPALRQRPLLTLKDMGMDHGTDARAEVASVDHSTMDHAAMGHVATEVTTQQLQLGPAVASLATNPVSRLHERPLGLEHEPHRVLVYSELRSLLSNTDVRAPSRELQLHLTANMERYVWAFDGVKFSEITAPIPLLLNERVRITFVNDTMMPHPLHLHGMFFELVSQENHNNPRKHTLVLKPGEKAAVDLTVDALGLWAFHCHLLYHMHAGMMRLFHVRAAEGEV